MSGNAYSKEYIKDLDFNEATFHKQQRLVYWCNGHDQGNYRSIHSDEYKSKTSKKYEYY